ncbi:hypothetical protein D3C78_1022630 [compost metagenome]
MHGLHVNHAEAVVDRHPAALVDRQVMVRVGLADGEGLPQRALAVIGDGARHGERLCIHVVHTLGQRVACIHRGGLHLVDLAQLPGDIGEAATLAAEGHHLITVAVLMGFVVQLQVIVVIERHEHETGPLVGPLHVGDASVVALEVLDHQVRAEECVGHLTGG